MTSSINQCIQIVVNNRNNSMIDVGLTIAKVKVYTKKYKTSKGRAKETKTKTINLGANAPFNDGDAVFIINESDFDRVTNNQEHNEEIISLNQQIKDFQRTFKELEKKYQEQFHEIQGMKKDNEKL